jgi:hypothetical protein
MTPGHYVVSNRPFTTARPTAAKLLRKVLPSKGKTQKRLDIRYNQGTPTATGKEKLNN